MPRYKFRLFVTGQGGHTPTAITNLRAIGSQFLNGDFELDIIDVLDQPAIAEEARVTMTPTLLKDTPLPARRLVGDLSHTARVLAALDISTASDGNSRGRS